MVYDASNRKHIRSREKSSKLVESNDIAYLRQIMSTLSGREWMHRFLVSCSMFQEPFSPMSPYATAYNCGKQGVGRKLFDEIFNNCAHEYTLMIAEAQAKEAADGRRTSDTDERSSEPNARRNDQGSRGFDATADGFVVDNSAADESAGDYAAQGQLDYDDEGRQDSTH